MESPPAEQARPGVGHIRVASVAGRSTPITLRATSPLRLLPTGGEPAPWVFTSTFGGGLVAGDRVELDVELEPATAMVLTTQASTKVYRSPPGPTPKGTANVLRARVGRDALLAVLPDPLVCFADARFEQRSTFELASGAQLVFLDVLTAGRVARDERWALASHRATLSIAREGRLLLRDATLLDPLHGPLATRMGRFDAYATLALVGLPELSASIAAQLVDPVAAGAPIVESASARADAGEDLLLVRFAATEIEPLMARVRALLQPVFPRIGDPFARKR